MAIPRAFGSLISIALVLLVVVTPLCTSKLILYSGETLPAGKCLSWRPGIAYSFCMQTDCNLVEYEDGNPIWASQTYGRGSNCSLKLQSDGNLVIYNEYQTPVWASNTHRGEGTYVVILQKDRNVVLYGPARWATNTNIDGASGGIFIKSKATVFGALPDANNATDHEPAKASGIAMVVNNIVV